MIWDSLIALDDDEIFEFERIFGRLPNIYDLLMYQEAKASVALSQDSDGTYAVGVPDEKIPDPPQG